VQQFESLAEELVGRVDELTATHLDRMRGDIPEWFQQPEPWAQIRAFSRASILTELLALRQGAKLPATCPQVDAEGARETARTGSSLDLMLTGYRCGNAVQWEAWFELVERQITQPERRRALLQKGSRFFFDYADRLSRFVTEEYSRERERAVRGYEQRRVQAVREVLDGGAADRRRLDYELEGSQLAVVGFGEAAGEAIGDLARTLDRRLLLVAVSEEACWAWLGADRALDERGIRALTAFRPPPGARIALGSEAWGVEGFRQSHVQALKAARAPFAGDRPLTRYDDIALEAMAAESETEARAFIARELRGLHGADARSRRLRETLRAYFAANQNATSAAAALGVHEHTVARRLQAVEERIGRPVASRRAELETALRLLSYLGTGEPAGQTVQDRK
jgi:PucR-like helix-turn-helix protein/diguanylate cyclase with GGDEF domain